ncbi:hypothetical protein HK100_005437, partial [Physocladia obscura]
MEASFNFLPGFDERSAGATNVNLDWFGDLSNALGQSDAAQELGPDQESGSGPKKRGRKPANTEPATKRIAQVRSAARAYRERKEKYVADLEATVKQLQGERQGDSSELTRRVQQLEAENSRLRLMAVAFDPSHLSSQMQQPVPPYQSPVFQHHQNQQHLYQQQQQYDQASSHLTTPPAGPVANNDIDFFSSISFRPLPSNSFKQTHGEMDYSNIRMSDLDALLDIPLPEPPSPEDVIEPHFDKVKEYLKNVPSLVDNANLVDDLCRLYVRFINRNTDECSTVQGVCRFTYGEIQVTQGKIIDICISVPDDLDKVMRLFETVKKEYDI